MCLNGKISAKKEDEFILKQEKLLLASNRKLAQQLIKLNQDILQQKKEHLLFTCIVNEEAQRNSQNTLRACQDSYVELSENKQKLQSLFFKEKILIDKVKLNNGIEGLIEDGCYINLADIYFHFDDIYRIENSLPSKKQQKDIDKTINSSLTKEITQKRYSGLHELLRTLLEQEKAITNKEMWEKLKKQISNTAHIRANYLTI